MRVKRRDLRPGNMFRNPFGSWLERVGIADLLVVLDGKNEVGFWGGRAWSVGEVGPDLFVEVVC